MKNTIKGILGLVAVLGFGFASSESWSEDIGSLLGMFDSETEIVQDTIVSEGVLTEQDIPTYDGTKNIFLNGNQANFTEEELAVTDGFYEFENIDSLNRAGTANALLTPEMYNTEERDSITVDPTGFKNKKIDGSGYLYNRSHLIGYSFINADIDIIPNLITGTRDFNADRDWGMLHYEDLIRDEIKSNPNAQIRFQVTPVFFGEELVARGVQMRAYSLHNDSIDFNVFIYNVQDGAEINYTDGTSVVSNN